MRVNTMGNEASQSRQAVRQTQCQLNLAPVPYIFSSRPRSTSSTESSPRSTSPSFRCDDTSSRQPLVNEMVERGPGGCRTPPETNGKHSNGVNRNLGQTQILLHQQVYQGSQRAVEGRHRCLQETFQPAGVVNNIVSTGHFCNAPTMSVNENQGGNTIFNGGELATDRVKPQPLGPHITTGELSPEIGIDRSDIVNTETVGALPRFNPFSTPLLSTSSEFEFGELLNHGNRDYQINTDTYNTGAVYELQSRECGSGLQSDLSARTGKSLDTQSFSVNSEVVSVSSSSTSLNSKSYVACDSNQPAFFDDTSINGDAYGSIEEHKLTMNCIDRISETTQGSIGLVCGPRSESSDYRLTADDYLSKSGGFMIPKSRQTSDIMLGFEEPSFGPISGICPSLIETMNSQCGENTQSFLAMTDSVDHVSRDDIFRDDHRAADQIVDVADGLDDPDGRHSISGYFSSSPGPSSMTSCSQGPSPVTSPSEITEAKKPRIFGGQNLPPYFSHTFDSQGFHSTFTVVEPMNEHTGSFCPPNHVHSNEVTRSRVFGHTTCAPDPPQEALAELFDSYNSFDGRDMSGSSGFISPVTDPSSPVLGLQVNLSLTSHLLHLKKFDQDSNKENAASNKRADQWTTQTGMQLRPNQTGIPLRLNQNIQPSSSNGSPTSGQEFLTSGGHHPTSQRGLSPIQNGGQGGNGRLCLGDDRAEELSSEEEDLHEQGAVCGHERTHKQQESKDGIKSAGQQIQIKFPAPEIKKEQRIYFDEPANDMLSIFDGPHGRKRYYAAYLCCAPQDLEKFGIPFHAMIEYWGFRIFLAPRDLVLSGSDFENMSRALEERCNGKIIVILSNNYASSGECQFLTAFARVLDPDAKRRNIIPVQIDKNLNEFPNVLKGLCIIRYNHDYKCGWLKRKLVDAIAA